MTSAQVPLLDSLSALADPTRCRMLRLLDRQELTVTELCAVLQLPQSTVSRHLKTLGDAEWVTSRRDGTSRYYTAAVAGLPRQSDAKAGLSHQNGAEAGRDAARAQIWELTRTQLGEGAGAGQDERRLASVLAKRSQTSREFFATAAGKWDRVRAELFGADFAAPALLALLPRDWVVADLGCGTGSMLAMLAPHVQRVIGVDASAEMLAAAGERTAALDNVELRAGSLEALPLDDRSVDAALLTLVLHHLPSPAAALVEAARVLKPGGRVLIVDMAPHDHEEYRQQMGHVWLGFSVEQIQRWLADAGFEPAHVFALSPGADAKGPALFVASAAKISKSPDLQISNSVNSL
jgi:ArsR family transcriptional regulator